MSRHLFHYLSKKAAATLLTLAFFSSAQAAPTCDSLSMPVVFVHGFMGAGDNWALQARRFVMQGHCHERIYMFDWNSMNGRQKSDSLLEAFLLAVLHRTKSKKLALVAHSAGGGLCYRFLKDSARSSLVSHYIHIGSSMLEKDAGPGGSIPTLVIGSRDDKIVPIYKGSRVSRQLILEGKDHMEVASCYESFEVMYEFLQGRPPENMPLKEEGDSLFISGKVLLFGNNRPLPGTEIAVYRFDAGKGKRLDRQPWQSLLSDESGRYPPFKCRQQEWLEFELSSAGRKISYYYKTGRSSDPHVYLRGFPKEGLAAMFLKKIPVDSSLSVIAAFSSGHAMIAGRDSLVANDVLLTPEKNAPAAKTLMAVFLYDNGDGISSYESHPDQGAGIFLSSLDMAITPGNEKRTTLSLHGEKLVLGNRPSDSAIDVVIFCGNDAR